MIINGGCFFWHTWGKWSEPFINNAKTSVLQTRVCLDCNEFSFRVVGKTDKTNKKDKKDEKEKK